MPGDAGQAIPRRRAVATAAVRESTSNFARMAASCLEAARRAEKAVCTPGDARCYDFTSGVKTALASGTPAGWCCISLVAADSGRTSWDAWFNVKAG
jgi:hypothetical protein